MKQKKEEHYLYRLTPNVKLFSWKEDVFNKGMLKMVSTLLIGLFLFIGQVKCWNKMVTSDWDPIGKREIVYTVSFFTCLGTVVGYFDIED